MDKHNSFFTPDQVDEQTELHSGSWPQEPGTPEAQTLADLQQIGRLFRASQEPILQRTWLRLQERSKRQAGSFPHQRREPHMKETEVRSFPANDRQAKPAAPRKLARVIGSVMAAAVVLLLVVAWMVVLPAFHAQKPGSLVGSARHPKQSTSSTSNLAKQICTFTDTRQADAGFSINYSLDWSKTNNIAFTHRDSGVVNGTNCAQASSYHDSMSIPEGAVWSPDGQNLLAFTITTTGNLTTTALQIVNSNGQLLHSVPLQTAGPEGSVSPTGSGWLSASINLSDNKSTIWGPAWSPDGSEFSAIFSPGGTFYLMTWETQSQKQVLDQPLNLFGAAITKVAWSPDGQYVALATDNPAVGVLLVNAHTGALVKHLATQSAPVSKITNLAWSPDGQELATSSADNLVRVWQVATGKLKYTFVGATATSVDEGGPDLQIAWSPDGNEIAAGDQKTVVWDVSSGHIVATIPHTNQIVVALAWSPDSQRLATLSTSGTPGSQTKATLATWNW